MEHLAFSDDTLCFMGVDPGTNSLGVGKIDFCPRLGVIRQTSAVTYVAEKYVQYDTDELEDSDLRRYRRLRWHEDNLYHLFCLHQPVRLAVETNYISRRTPSAYGPLVESVLTIRNAARRYDERLPIVLIDPVGAKNAVSARTRGLSKEENKLAVWRAVGELRSTLALAEENWAALSEHASDAVAITYCAYLRYRNTFR